MNHTLDLTRCAEADIARTGAFYDKVVLWLSEHENLPKWTYRVYPSEEIVRAMTAAKAQYICLMDGEIVGAFALGTEPQGRFDKCRWKRNLPEGAYMVLRTLAIDESVRGQGIGGRIIRFCVDLAKSAGCAALRVDVVPSNVPARRFYEKYGFTYAGDVDLELNVKDVPVFSMYELNW
ncbi:MAG: GNAT family N-acetyltransferase [Eubacteriaceae bacterium]|nr:GNAT family N-acetyltransferase [Eubacteriaceae bacterium]